MQLKDLCETFEFKITGGSDYHWDCYGPNVRYMDFESDHAHGSCLFDTVTQEIYEVNVDRKEENMRPYRWLNPNTKDEYLQECIVRGIDPNQAWDDTKWCDLEVESDFHEKANAIFRGEPFDDRIQVPLDFTDKEMLELALEAHRRDMTINEFVEEALRYAIEKHKVEQGS
jgi:predicted HicB family RNase H-like nuclease